MLATTSTARRFTETRQDSLSCTTTTTTTLAVRGERGATTRALRRPPRPRINVASRRLTKQDRGLLTSSRKVTSLVDGFTLESRRKKEICPVTKAN